MRLYLSPIIYFLMVLFACTGGEETSDQSEDSDLKVRYNEKFRPQFHYSPQKGWMNDPNGMVYYDGLYHLFYQYNPDTTVWGPMHWGHAVSTDLIYWENRPIALYPDSLGMIFSGSAVVDKKNTTGFGTTSEPPLVAIFTHHKAESEKTGASDYQYQSLAYSTDNGKTWTKYQGNPVLANPGDKRDFRDPKVFWYAPSSKWIMVLAVGDHLELYHSPNLKDWSYLSEFGIGQGEHGGVWECPDLFPLTAEDGTTRWIMLVSINPGGPYKGSATQYFVGSFDGKKFISDYDSTSVHWLDYGKDNYAGVTWSDIPKEDGRRIFIGWMSNWQYAEEVPSETWRSAMTVPRELKLINKNGEWLVASKPIKELKKLETGSIKIARQLYQGLADMHVPSSMFRITLDIIRMEEKHDFVFTLSNKQTQRVNFGYNPNKEVFFFDRITAGVDAFNSEFNKEYPVPFKQLTDTMKLDVLVDHSSIEIFVNNGELVLTELVFPSSPYSNCRLDTKTQALLMNGTISEMKSIWNE